jgi:hypothetical protein
MDLTVLGSVSVAFLLAPALLTPSHAKSLATADRESVLLWDVE